MLIPGIQGRWEWMEPTVEALAREYRVITASLPGEPGASLSFGAEPTSSCSSGIWTTVLDAAGVSTRHHVRRLVWRPHRPAVRRAAQRNRVRGLILVSTPGPRLEVEPHVSDGTADWPTLTSPLFARRRGAARLARAAGAVSDAARPVECVRQDGMARRDGAGHAPARMSRRARLAERQDFEADCACVTAPDARRHGRARARSGRAAATKRMSYLDLIPGSRFQLFERTGHLGTVLAPDRFAAHRVEIFPDAMTEDIRVDDRRHSRSGRADRGIDQREGRTRASRAIAVLGASAADGRRHDAHESACFTRPRRWRESACPSCVSTSAASGAVPDRFRAVPASRMIFARRSTS